MVKVKCRKIKVKRAWANKSKPPGASICHGGCGHVFGTPGHTYSDTIHTHTPFTHGALMNMANSYTYQPTKLTHAVLSRALVARRSTYRASCLSSERSMSLVRTCSHTSTLGRSHTTLGTLSWPITSHKLIDCACLQLAVGGRWEGSMHCSRCVGVPL